jgi:hypothetical protein
VVTVGIFSAIACSAFVTRRKTLLLLSGTAAGVLLAFAATETALPDYVLWMFPPLAFLGAAAVAASVRPP